MTCALCRFYDVCMWHNDGSDMCIEIRQVDLNRIEK